MKASITLLIILAATLVFIIVAIKVYRKHMADKTAKGRDKQRLDRILSHRQSAIGLARI